MRKIEVVLTSRRKYATAANKINLSNGKRRIGVCGKRREEGCRGRRSEAVLGVCFSSLGTEGQSPHDGIARKPMPT